MKLLNMGLLLTGHTKKVRLMDPNIYKSFPSITHKTHKVKRPKPRGDNYMVTFTKRFKALFHWCHAQGITSNNPFTKYTTTISEKYGTPIYIKDEEVLQLADFDFSYNKHLDTQRDKIGRASCRERV